MVTKTPEALVVKKQVEYYGKKRNVIGVLRMVRSKVGFIQYKLGRFVIGDNPKTASSRMRGEIYSEIVRDKYDFCITNVVESENIRFVIGERSAGTKSYTTSSYEMINPNKELLRKDLTFKDIKTIIALYGKIEGWSIFRSIVKSYFEEYHEGLSDAIQSIAPSKLETFINYIGLNQIHEFYLADFLSGTNDAEFKKRLIDKII
jgi:hypothetical protein